MVRMPDITPGSLVPDRHKFTAGRIFRTTLLVGVALVAFGAGTAVLGRSIVSGASQIDELYALADTFGEKLFTDIRPEVLLASVVSAVMVPIFVALALAGMNKSIRRAVDHVDQEWYGEGK